MARRCRSHQRKTRTHRLEQLEQRLLLSADWQNPARPADVNNDGIATALDALMVINRLSANRLDPSTSSQLPQRTNPLDLYYDVSADGHATALDALHVLNEMWQIRQGTSSGHYLDTRVAGESEIAPAGFISTPLTTSPGDAGQLVDLQTAITINSHEFNEIGLYVADNSAGAVAGLSPGSPGYAQAVFASPQRTVLYSRRDLARDTHDVTMPAAANLRVYVLQSYSQKGAVEEHIQVVDQGGGTWQIGWEQHGTTLSSWPTAGDGEFDDTLVDIQISPPYEQPTGWESFQVGGSDSGRGTATEDGQAINLVEGDSLLVGLRRSVIVSQSLSGVALAFQTPAWDTLSAERMRDAFEVVVTDLQGNPIVVPYAAGRTAAMNWSEQTEAARSSAVQWQSGGNPDDNQHELLVNLAHLPLGSEVLVTARLVNNDGDDTSSVTVTGWRELDGLLPEPEGSWAIAAATTAAATGPLDPSRLQELSSSLRVDYGRTSYTEDRSQLITEITVSNLGSQAISGRLILVIDQLSDLETFALRPDGILPDGRPFLDLSDQLDGVLQPGQTTGPLELRFTNPGQQRFTYRLSALGEVNRRPTGFTSTPLRQIEAGHTYHYLATAEDIDGDPLRYTLVVGPETMTVNPQSGQISWPTAGEDVGSHRMVLRASDPSGLSVEQAFAIEVFESLANRPPNFITDPVTEAIASAGFETATVATGAGPSLVTTLDGLVGPRLVSLDGLAQTVATYVPGVGNGYQFEAAVSTGEPLPTDDPFQAGYSVDLGLEPFVRSSSRNDMLGLDQADFNGDGVLDLVTMAVTYDMARQVRTEYELIVTLGDGIGNFGTPLSIPLRNTGQGNFDYVNLRAADINRDGHVDLLLLERQLGSLMTVLGNGDGTFQAVVETPLEPKLHDFRVGDVDSDGVPDLYGRNSNFSQFGWLPGMGDGTFGSFREIASGDQVDNFASLTRPYHLVDFDDDGDMDVIWARSSSSAIDFLANDGEEGFTLVHTIAPQRPDYTMGATTPAVSIWVADFTGDGRVDILYTPRWSDAMGLYASTETPLEYEYQYALDPAFDMHSGAAFLGNPAGDDAPIDIDGDGDLDVVLGSIWTGPNSVPLMVLRNEGGVFSWTPYATVNHAGAEALDEVHHYSDVSGVLVGDYNGDGVMDLAHTTLGYSGDFNGLGILPGTRPGDFAGMHGVQYPGLASHTDGVLVADFNADGILDLATTTPALTALGRGDGTFETPIPSYQAAQYSNSRGITADFDLDGFADVFTTYGRGFSTQRFRSLMGNGDGTLEPVYGEVIPNVLYAPTHLATADFNLDGHPDILTRSACSPAQIDVLLYNPEERGTFTQATTIPLEGIGIDCNGFVNTTAIADFTGDGIPDIALVDEEDGVYSSNPLKLVVMAGLGDGTFEVFSELFPYGEIPSSTPSSLVSGDINGDGLIDLVTSDISSRLLVHLATGPGTFADATSYVSGRVARGVHDLYLRDVDGDGNLDLITTDYADSTISVRQGLGDGTFTFPYVYDDLGSQSDIVFADIDHDGHLDAIKSPVGGTYGTITVLSGARGTLVDGLTVDLDGDGNQEVLAINEANDRLKLFVGDNLGGLTRQADLLTGRAPRAVATADLDGDGQIELITANRAGRSLSLFSGSLDAGYTSQEMLVGSAPIDVAATDLDGDGHTDLVVLDEVAQALWIFVGNGTATLADPVAVALGDVPGRLTLADADGDGRIDAVVTLPDSNRLMLLAGDGAGGFLAPHYVNTDSAPSDVAAVDVNADGLPDLATVLPGGNRVDLFYGRGNGQYSTAQTIDVGAEPTRIVTRDVDSDGRIDFIVSNTGESTATVIYNRFDPNQVYRYPSEAVDPDGDPLTYSISDGPGGLLINAQTGELFWAASPNQVGLHEVTIAADDGRGGVATQSYRIDVRPARENAGPLIASEPATQIGAYETFAYQVQAIDADGDPLRYRIIDGPEDATIDPTTGQLRWDARVDGAIRFAPDGFGRTSGHVSVPADESLQPASITVEGWYNFPSLPASNGREYLIRQSGGRGEAYALFNTGNRLLELQMQFADYNDDIRFAIPFVPEIDRWYHIAITIDDASRLASVIIDGVTQGTVSVPQPIYYDPDADAAVGNATTYFSRSIVDNVRIWNVARSEAEIRAGMSRQYDDDSRLVLDYRFEATDTLTVIDHSAAMNHGVRTANGLLPARALGLADPGAATFTIGVADGRGGEDIQTFTVTILPELRGALTGQLFADLDGDGVRAGDGTEGTLVGWNVYIDSNGNQFPDADEPQTTTDADGTYRFEKLLPGDYSLRVAPVAGYAPPQAGDVSVAANEVATLDWAIEQLALGQIRGRVQADDGRAIAHLSVFADLDGNGLLDADEPQTLTDGGGNYALSGLPEGQFTVLPERLAGWGYAAGSDQQTVVLPDQGISTDIDFTLQPLATSAVDGLHFVTTAAATAVARDVYRYAAHAVGIDTVTVRYDLPMAPEGMTVDPATGLVAWRPSIEQLGTHSVVLRATSAGGSITLQDFSIEVTAANFAPLFTSLPPSIGYVGRAYAYSIVAQDAENESISYTLVDGPAGATIGPDGRIDWTPDAEGSFRSTVQAIDTSGDATSNATTTDFTVTVQPTAPAALPLDVTFPRTNAQVLVAYIGQVTASDGLGRDVQWTLQSGPAGLTLSVDGHLNWMPTIAQLGTHQVALLATTADGEAEHVSLTLAVTGSMKNASPLITSTPVRSAVINREYAYDIVASDADSDLLAFTLIEGPAGMSVDGSRGTVRWTPAADQLGEARVQIRVADVVGAEVIHPFTICVSRVGGPPIIVSVPPTEAVVGTTYLYTVLADDAQGDTLTYRLLTAPAGMTIVETTGEIAYTPDASNEGWQTVAIEVADGSGGASTQAFAILVGLGANNLPPQIASEAPRFGAVATPYRYAMAATDPEGTTLVYSVSRGPAGMTVDADSGLVVWTPDVDQTGKHMVTLRATDAAGASAVESFELDVLAENRAPAIAGQPPVQIAAGTQLVFDLQATDPDLDSLAYERVAGPAGAEVDAFGRLMWSTTNADVGSHPFEVQVRDPRGGVATAAFSLEVVEDTEPPVLSVIHLPGDNTRNILPWQGPVTVYVRAFDNVELASVTLQANGVDIPLSAAGTATFTFEQYGFTRVFATATAVDVNGNVTTRTTSFDYDIPEGWSGIGGESVPTAIISSPADDAAVTGLVPIIGTANHDDFALYRLSYRRADHDRYTEILRSDVPVSDGQLAIWDTSLLANDHYIIRLEVATTDGMANVVEHSVGLGGGLKLGNFQMSFTDLVIPIAGIPIEITRIYDTLYADREGDFGYGWRLEYGNTDLRVSLPNSGLEDIGIHSPLRPGVKVYLNVPGEGRQGFTFQPDVRVLPGLGGDNLVLARPRFIPDPGVTSSLGTGTSGYLQVNEWGELFAPGAIPYNPASPDFGGVYVLTTANGTRYRIDGQTGKLTSIIDTNGNALVFADNGIHGMGGAVGIDIQRDARGRIVSITDAEGIGVQYRYTAGDLTTVADADGNSVQFQYDDSHRITAVTDPLGRPVVRNEYDDQGRLIRRTDAEGRVIQYAIDPLLRQEVVEDDDGGTTVYQYDNLGNAVSITDALGGTTRQRFDGNGNLLETVDPVGNQVIQTFDAAGNLTSRTDGTGAVHRFTYIANGRPATSTDPLGRTTFFDYDQNGNLIRRRDGTGTLTSRTVDDQGQVTTETDAQGNTTTFTYDTLGRQTSVTNANGAVISQQYDSNGTPTAFTSADGQRIEFTIDARGMYSQASTAEGQSVGLLFNELGELVSMTNSLGDPSFSLSFNSRQQETQFVDSLGNKTTRSYDTKGNLIAVTSASGAVTTYQYDLLGRLKSETRADGGVVQHEYDAAGRRLRSFDPYGAVTQYAYDAANRLISVTDPFGRTTSYQYDLAGQLVSTTNPAGGVTQSVYDHRGLQVATVFADGSRVDREFDSLGNLIASTDSLGRTTRFAYDPVGNLMAVTDADGARTTYTYDASDRLLSQTDTLGRQTRFEYDSDGRLVAKIYPDGVRETTVYEDLGRRTIETDAAGNATTVQLDANGNLLTRHFADGTSESFQYNASDQLLAATNQLGTTQYSYDDMGRLVSVSYPNDTSLLYSYNLRGQREAVSSILPDGTQRTTEYEYDSGGRLERVTGPDGATATYRYNSLDRVSGIAYSNGLDASFTHDSLGRVIGVSYQVDEVILYSVQYALDAAGQHRSATYSSGRTVQYQYNARGWLLSETHRDSSGTVIYSQRFQYDAVGNIIQQTSDGQAIAWIYNELDQLIGQGDQSFAYDASGRLIVQIDPAGSVSYTYDAEGQLVKVVQGDRVLEYQYDASGHRIGQIVDSQQTVFAVDQTDLSGVTQVIAAYDVTDGQWTDLTYGDRPLFVAMDGQTLALHQDASRNVVLVTNPTGEAVQQTVYSAFGETVESTGSVTVGLGFAGEVLDGPSDLVYLRARYYQPSTGRFLSRDAYPGDLDETQSLHRYLYGFNNPTIYVDPTGMMSFSLAEVQTSATILGGLTGATFAGIGAYAGGKRGMALVTETIIGGAFGAFGGAFGSALSSSFATSTVLRQAVSNPTVARYAGRIAYAIPPTVVSFTEDITKGIASGDISKSGFASDVFFNATVNMFFNVIVGPSSIDTRKIQHFIKATGYKQFTSENGTNFYRLLTSAERELLNSRYAAELVEMTVYIDPSNLKAGEKVLLNFIFDLVKIIRHSLPG